MRLRHQGTTNPTQKGYATRSLHDVETKTRRKSGTREDSIRDIFFFFFKVLAYKRSQKIRLAVSCALSFQTPVRAALTTRGIPCFFFVSPFV